MDSYMFVGSSQIGGVVSKLVLAVMTAAPRTTPWKTRRTRRHRRSPGFIRRTLIAHADDLVA
jgi:hypothetical protein